MQVLLLHHWQPLAGAPWPRIIDAQEYYNTNGVPMGTP